MKISVIVAAYNAEKYLEETLESIIDQTIDEYEVIVVNDGSIDSTREILDKYKAKYDIFQVIHKENGGPSSARNAGLEIAKGEYVFFFDADDILVKDALEKLYDRAIENEADLVIAKYDIFNKYRTFPVNSINGLVKRQEIQKYDREILWTFSLCNKLFKREVIEKYNLRLPPISYSEDGAFLMEYVYHAEKITGLNKVIFHYRRMYDGEAESITASVSPSKVRDYITAHQLILASAERSFLRDYQEYATIEEAKESNAEIYNYLNEIIYKEVSILVNQFYMKFWNLDEDTIRTITQEVSEKIQKMDTKSILRLIDENPDVSTLALKNTKKDVLENADFTSVLYGNEEEKEQFLSCLKSLTLQNLIGIKIVLPETMRTLVEDAEMMQDNLFFVDVNSKRELHAYALEHADTRYITFCDTKLVYTHNAFKYMFKRFIKSSADFMEQQVYHQNYGTAQPVFLNHAVLDTFKSGLEYSEVVSMNSALGNKFFRLDFLRKQMKNYSDNIVDYLEQFYKKGYYSFYNDGIVLFEDEERNFADFVATQKNRTSIEKYFEDKEISLNSEGILLNKARALSRLQPLPNRKFKDKLFRKCVDLLSKCELKNQVLFFSIRKDGKLEGNAKALYPYIKGKKVIFARLLPHNKIEQLIAFWRMKTSKVIVTDDYVRYLRHFSVRKDQRVIQLWHACGAFKKFGQRGTNLSIDTDLATHSQYNVVCVSSEYIRPLYADAFDVELQKVKALGCPRTDDFFNQELIAEIKEKIYKVYPELKQKKVIIYAPTFRDVGKDRTKFEPELDFDKLSEQLLPDQKMIICPHPVMENEILPRNYENIQVIRDFSTNELMFISDMLITDYSSVIFEYALLRKPIVFYCYDLATYNRGFYLKYPDDLPGEVYENQDELISYLQNPELHVINDRYMQFVQRYMSACDGHSSERIAQLINDYIEEK